MKTLILICCEMIDLKNGNYRCVGCFDIHILKSIDPWKGTVHKRRPQLGRGCLVRTFCGEGGFFRCVLSHFKNIGLFEVYGVSALTRAVMPVRAIADKGEGVNSSRFCADVLYERPL